MKNFLLLILIIISVFGCQSKEEKAIELIKNDMFKVLYDFNSYEPIETQIDSAFNSIYTDSLMLALAYNLNHLLEAAEKYLSEKESAERDMRIWENNYSVYARQKFNEAKNDVDESLEKMQASLEIIENLSSQMQKRKEQISSDFCGWKVVHKFRAKTKGGLSDIGNYMYIFDDKITAINYKEDLNDKEYAHLKSIIKEVVDRIPQSHQ